MYKFELPTIGKCCDFLAKNYQKDSIYIRNFKNPTNKGGMFSTIKANLFTFQLETNDLLI
jgi:hypothetical protein